MLKGGFKKNIDNSVDLRSGNSRLSKTVFEKTPIKTSTESFSSLAKEWKNNVDKVKPPHILSAAEIEAKKEQEQTRTDRTDRTDRFFLAI